MTKEYHNAIAKYYSKLRIVTVPVMAWDLCTSRRNEALSFNAIQREWNLKENFYKAVIQSKKTIIVTNARYEIVFVSDNISEMNGYRPEEVLAKSPKIFQGKLTCDVSRKNIKYALEHHLPFKEVILNYKKDGSTYLCEINAYPKFNAEGKLIHYIAFEKLAS